MSNTIERLNTRVHQIAERVKCGTLGPLEAARLIVTQHVGTDMPRTLLISSAELREGFDPVALMTSLDDDGSRAGEWHLNYPTARGGIQRHTRAMALPEIALSSTVSGFNEAGERLRVGGLGVNDSYDLGMAGFIQPDPMAPISPVMHAKIYQYMTANTDITVGHLHAVIDDGTFQDVPYGCAGQFISGNHSGHETVDSFPVTARAILALPNIVTFDYPVN